VEQKLIRCFFDLVKEYKRYNFIELNMQEKNAHHIEIIINSNIMNHMAFIAWAEI
jgi:hypothetical protein